MSQKPKFGKEVNKADLILLVAHENHLSKKDAAGAVNSFLDGVVDCLKKGKKVKLVPFGSFEAKERGARKGRNPQTGESIDIAATRSPSFKAGKYLKDQVSGRAKAAAAAAREEEEATPEPAGKGKRGK